MVLQTKLSKETTAPHLDLGGGLWEPAPDIAYWRVAWFGSWVRHRPQKGLLMPMFLMHDKERSNMVDDLEGAELPSLDHSIEEAIASLRSIATDCLTAGRPFTLESIVIIDVGGTTQVNVTVAEALGPVLSFSDLISNRLCQMNWFGLPDVQAVSAPL